VPTSGTIPLIEGWLLVLKILKRAN
jgi:hypothetical protein